MLELMAAAMILLIFVPLCRRARDGSLPKGRWWNAMEAVLIFVRDKIVQPALGEKHTAAFLPFFWTLFLFVLFCNLLGMIPLLGSPTANIWVTGGLALISFCMLHGVSIAQVGFWNYIKSMWLPIDVPYVGWIFSLMIFAIELMGTFIKSGVLAVRLFANMFAGHMVLATIVGFIWAAEFYWLWLVITPASAFGAAALSLLELFVAFLQAFVFTFLTALFMGMALHHAEHAAGHGAHDHGHGHEPGHGHAHGADHGPGLGSVPGH
jgi:F-type H+-transporting ATPase subunit a